MRRFIIAAAALAAFAAPSFAIGGVVTGGGGASIRGARDILGCADVRAFGAVGDGVADDTAAIQAAINSGASTGGPVCVPPGAYKVTSTLTLKKTTRLSGFNPSSRDSISGEPNVSVIDCSSLTNSTCLQGTGNAVGVIIEGLRIKGPSAAVAGALSAALNPGGGCVRCALRDLSITGFWYGIFLSAVNGVEINNVWADLQTFRGLDIYASSNVHSINSLYANTNPTGARAAADCGNVVIENGSADIIIDAPQLDEAFSPGAGGVKCSSLLVLAADLVQIRIGRLFYAHGGYGIRLGNGTSNPTRVKIIGTSVERFAAGTAPTYRIELRGSGHTLIDVTTDSADGGGRINDLATGTTYVNVDGNYKFPSLPTTRPDAGSNLLWVDPSAADSTAVRYAP
jgi:hypothetical protein